MFGNLFGSKDDFKGVYEKGAIVVDVRTPAEFADGHFPESVNIPLDTIADRMDFFKDAKDPLILICRSGGRAGTAKKILARENITSVNGGGWVAFQQEVSA